MDVNTVILKNRTLLRRIKTSARAAALVAMKDLEGRKKTRIFDEGKGTNNTLYGKPPASKGKLDPQGVYSFAHGKIRRRRGRQTNRKDLQLNGDLLRQLTTGTNRGDVVIGFLTDNARIIAVGQEGQTEKKIWQPTTQEVNETLRVFKRELLRGITR